MTIDCGALTETLLESELFGHVKGSFTGAIRAKRGLLEESQGGTIFLDEICEISPPTQTKLLRAIQEREIRPVGGNKSITIDVRFISATSRDVKLEVEKGRFREELYYRLAVVPLVLPPLKGKEGRPPSADRFLLEKLLPYLQKKDHSRKSRFSSGPVSMALAWKHTRVGQRHGKERSACRGWRSITGLLLCRNRSGLGPKGYGRAPDPIDRCTSGC